MISDEAVEAAARALWLGGTKEPHRIRRLREALEAAAPFIAAQAWDAAAVWVAAGNEVAPGTIPAANPYRRLVAVVESTQDGEA